MGTTYLAVDKESGETRAFWFDYELMLAEIAKARVLRADLLDLLDFGFISEDDEGLVPVI
jgi:hypothetical protein